MHNAACAEMGALGLLVAWRLLLYRGTAVAALTLCHSLQPDKAKKDAYEEALKRYSLFVTKGCSTPPTKPTKANATSCPSKGRGWVIPPPSPDAGALGDGYYQGRINLTPYTISTATTGQCSLKSRKSPSCR